MNAADRLYARPTFGLWLLWLSVAAWFERPTHTWFEAGRDRDGAWLWLWPVMLNWRFKLRP